MREEDIRKRDVHNRYLQLVNEDAEILFADKSDFEYIRCPACGEISYSSEFSKQGFSYVSCPSCSTLYLNPRPRFDKLMQFYADSKSTSYWVNEFFMPMAEARREKIFKPRADYVCETIPVESGFCIGDIGAGFGIFLEEMKKLRPDTRLIAIEPSIEQAEICRNKGMEVMCRALEDLDSGPIFNLLISYELFEHLHEPQVFIKKIYELLKPGGYFLMTTLNGLGFDIQLLWEKSKSISPPHHINFFNPQSISLLLQQNGFDIIQVSTPGVLDWDITEGMMRNEGVRLERFWHLLSEKADESCKQGLQQWITNANLSSHMRVLARKP